MTFHVVKRSDLPASSSPVRLVDEGDREIEWANRFLDLRCVRGLQTLSLESYAYTLLHFVRWWSSRPGVDVMRFAAEQFYRSHLCGSCAQLVSPFAARLWPWPRGQRHRRSELESAPARDGALIGGAGGALLA